MPLKEQPAPLSIEPLGYEVTLPGTWNSTFRVVAILGLIIGVSRVLQALMAAWVFNMIPGSPFTGMQWGGFVRELGMIQGTASGVLGVILLVGASGLLRGRTWARGCVVVNEVAYLCVTLLLIIGYMIADHYLATGTAPTTPVAMLVYDGITELGQIVGVAIYPLAAIMLLRRR